MTFPPTTSSLPPPAFQPEPLLSVACPTCFGAIAVGAELLGQAAECPLCGHGFRVPLPGIVDVPWQPASAGPAAGSPSAEPSPRRRKRRRETAPTPPPHEPAGHSGPEDSSAEPQPRAASETELQFQEPVRTVGRGDQMITLRRLTPEEKAVRRARRNLIMMMTGLSILMAIVLLLGTRRPKRRD